MKRCLPSLQGCCNASRGGGPGVPPRLERHGRKENDAVDNNAVVTRIITNSHSDIDRLIMFGSVPLNGAFGAPAWSELPAEARAALTSLMTQLILDHAAAMATPRAKEVGHDL